MAEDVTKRVRYFDHQFLRVDEFTTEQDYHIERRRRLTLGLHSPGVVEGLAVDQTDRLEVVVSAGWAIDPAGRELILPAREAISLTARDGDVDLILIYPNPERESDPSGDPGVDGENTRVDEKALLSPPDPAPPAGVGVPLARVTIASGAISSVKDLRAFAGVAERNLVDGSVSNAKLADNAVSTSKIRNAAVTGPKISDGAVSETKLQNGAVTEAKIQDNAITEAKIRDGAVSFNKLAQPAVREQNILDGAVTGVKIRDKVIGVEKFDAYARAGQVGGYAVFDKDNGGLLNPHNIRSAKQTATGRYEFVWHDPLSKFGPVFVFAYAPLARPGPATAFITAIDATGVAVAVVDSGGRPMDAIVNVMAFGETGERP